MLPLLYVVYEKTLACPPTYPQLPGTANWRPRNCAGIGSRSYIYHKFLIERIMPPNLFRVTLFGSISRG